MRSWVIRAGAAGLAVTLGPGATIAQPGTPPANAATASPPAVAATVNGETIPLDQVDALIKTKFTFAPLTAGQTRQVRVELTAELVDDLLLKQFLRQHGPKVDPAEIDKQLQAFIASLTRQGKTFADFLKETNQTEASVRESWTTLQQLNRYVKEHVSDEQLKQYYAANRDYFDRVEVRVSHIVIRVGSNTPEAEKARAREKLQSLRADVAAGKLDFSAAAKKHSQCPSSPQGGDIGYILRKGMLVDEGFCKAAFSLKVGEVSEVVQSDYGLHLIKVTDRKAGTPSTFEKCVEDVRDTFVDDFRTQLVAKLRKEAKVQITVP